MLGRAAIAMWWDFPVQMQPEIEDWHSKEHFAERLGIPGFLRGSRWIDVAGRPSFFIIYEAARLATITAGPYLDRLNNPTPWSRRMMPHHLNMMRSLCRVSAGFGGGLACAMATVRYSPARGGRSLAKRLAAEVVPELARRRGITGAFLLESLATPGGAQTTEQAIRGGDAAADSVLLVNGYDAMAVRAAVENDLSPDALTKRGAQPGATVGLYSLSYCATSKDFS
jgi:hypothetical protein